MSEIKLKPCPRCGRDTAKVTSYINDRYCALCRVCLCMVGYFDTPKEAAEAWNNVMLDIHATE